MTSHDGRPDTQREARSIARLMIIIALIAAIPATAMAAAWIWWR